MAKKSKSWVARFMRAFVGKPASRPRRQRAPAEQSGEPTLMPPAPAESGNPSPEETNEGLLLSQMVAANEGLTAENERLKAAFNEALERNAAMRLRLADGGINTGALASAITSIEATVEILNKAASETREVLSIIRQSKESPDGEAE